MVDSGTGKTPPDSTAGFATGTGAARPSGIIDPPEIDFNTKLIAVIEDGGHRLYTKEGERLNYLTTTIIIDDYSDTPKKTRCEFEMIVGGIIGRTDCLVWGVGSHKVKRWLHWLISPLGKEYYFNTFFRPFGMLDDVRVRIQCDVELRNEPPRLST